MGVTLTAGLSLKWFRDVFCGEETRQAKREGRDVYDALSAMAASVPAGSEGLLFLPYLNGERTPHGDADARGLFCGLTLRHGKAHLARAIMEGVTFGLRDSLELIREVVSKFATLFCQRFESAVRHKSGRHFLAHTINVQDAATFRSAASVSRHLWFVEEAVGATARRRSSSGGPVKYRQYYSLYHEL
jgi:glycerol kinase